MRHRPEPLQRVGACHLAATVAVLVVVLVAVATAAVPVLLPAAVPAAWAQTPPPDAVSVAPAFARYQLPVEGEVSLAFLAPPGPYDAGHRGADLAVPAGTRVGAAAAGIVAFAGTVAGRRWVSLDHADGIRTTYGPLTRIDVRTGVLVARAGVVGLSGTAPHGPGPDALHWSARRDGRYLDPLSLIDAAAPWVPTLLEDAPGGWYGIPRTDLPAYDDWDGEHSWGRVPGSPEATAPGFAFAPNPNHVIGVAGLNSSTGGKPMDLAFLGYANQDITYLSYAGRDPDAPDRPDDPFRDQNPWEAQDTWRGVEVAARMLADQLRAQQAADPDRGVDLVGHSLGGVVIMYYLLYLHDPADPTLPPIDHVVTIASPLEGADLADAGRAADTTEGGRFWVAALLTAIGMDIDLSSQVIEDLATRGDLVGALGDGWEQAIEDLYAGPLANGTDVLTLGGEMDYIVPEHRSDLPGAEHVVLPGDHDGVRLTEGAAITVDAFLANQPVPGEAGGAGHWLSQLLGELERGVGKDLALLPPPEAESQPYAPGPPGSPPLEAPDGRDGAG